MISVFLKFWTLSSFSSFSLGTWILRILFFFSLFSSNWSPTKPFKHTISLSLTFPSSSSFFPFELKNMNKNELNPVVHWRTENKNLFFSPSSSYKFKSCFPVLISGHKPVWQANVLVIKSFLIFQDSSPQKICFSCLFHSFSRASVSAENIPCRFVLAQALFYGQKRMFPSLKTNWFCMFFFLGQNCSWFNLHLNSQGKTSKWPSSS